MSPVRSSRRIEGDVPSGGVELAGGDVGADDVDAVQGGLGAGEPACVHGGQGPGPARPRGLQEVAAFAGPFGGKGAVAAGDQPFAGVVGVGDLGQVGLIEQG